MNQLTSTVITMKSITKGTVQWNELFSDVYYGVQASMDAIVNSYAYSLKGDVAEGESLAMMHIETAIDKFQYQGFEFLTFYKKTLQNKMIDLVRSFGADKAKHNTSYEVSLSAEVESNFVGTFLAEDRFSDKALQSTDTYIEEDTLSIGTLLDSYTVLKPVEAGVIELIIQYNAEGFQKKDFSQAIARYYGSDTYTNALQARVSRAIKGFRKYASESGYNFQA